MNGEIDGGTAVLRVRDTGVGISRESLPGIFELFAQGDGTPGRLEGGLGVGLALARMLVELHGGTLTASSDGDGGGSEFVVRLPLGTAPVAVPQPAERPSSQPTRRRVLVVEDHEDSREVLRLALELEGHHVETAADGAEGVELALRMSPDIVLVDIGLPSLDGYAVAQRIRDALGDSVLLVALTGYGRDDDRRRTAGAGFDAHLVKPVDFESVARLLEGRDSV